MKKFLNYMLLAAMTVGVSTLVACGDDTPPSPEGKSYKIALSVSGEGHGTAVSEPANEAPATTEVTVTATANEGYRFVRWTVVSGQVELENPNVYITSFAMPPQDVAIRAEFEAEAVPPGIEIYADPAEGGNAVYETYSKDPVTGESIEPQIGMEIILHATANEGYMFKEWVLEEGLVDNGGYGNEPIDHFTDANKVLPTVSVWIGSQNLKIKAVFVPDTFGDFPDPAFKGYVAATFDTDDDGTLSQAEMDAVTEINVVVREIKSLAGIENFKNLVRLNCEFNEIEMVEEGHALYPAFDLSQNTKLEYLDFSQNPLGGTPDLSKNTALKSLTCYGVMGRVDPVTGEQLTPDLTTLDLSTNVALEKLDCRDNAITGLNLSTNVALKQLHISNTAIETLDLAGNVALEELVYTMGFRDTHLTALRLGSPDVFLDGDFSSVTTLVWKGAPNNVDVRDFTAVQTLCLADSPALATIDISKNVSLTTLDVSKTSVVLVNAETNPALMTIHINSNSMTADQAHAFVAALPQRAEFDGAGVSMYEASGYSALDVNERMTANGKNWRTRGSAPGGVAAPADTCWPF